MSCGAAFEARLRREPIDFGGARDAFWRQFPSRSRWEFLDVSGSEVGSASTSELVNDNILSISQSPGMCFEAV